MGLRSVLRFRRLVNVGIMECKGHCALKVGIKVKGES